MTGCNWPIAPVSAMRPNEQETTAPRTAALRALRPTHRTGRARSTRPVVSTRRFLQVQEDRAYPLGFVHVSDRAMQQLDAGLPKRSCMNTFAVTASPLIDSWAPRAGRKTPSGRFIAPGGIVSTNGATGRSSSG